MEPTVHVTDDDDASVASLLRQLLQVVVSKER